MRAYKAIGRDPITIRAGCGAHVTDADGRSYIDYVCSYGPLILGHAPNAVTAAIAQAAAEGTSFGMPTEAETTLLRVCTGAGGESTAQINSRKGEFLIPSKGVFEVFLGG